MIISRNRAIDLGEPTEVPPNLTTSIAFPFEQTIGLLENFGFRTTTAEI
jgi:hypothetical protein